MPKLCKECSTLSPHLTRRSTRTRQTAPAGELEALCFAQCVRDISVVFEKEKVNAETG
jgi:hypothetical protein